MKLRETIKSLVDDCGSSVIESSLFINILHGSGVSEETIVFRNVLNILMNVSQNLTVKVMPMSYPASGNACCMSFLMIMMDRPFSPL